MMEIFSDGGSRGNPGPAASAFVILKDDKVFFANAKYLGKATNNVAEYNGVILALEWIVKNKEKDNIRFFMDSELVVKQINGNYKVKDKNLMTLWIRVKRIIADNNLKVNFIHVPREKNAFADNLVNEKLDESSRI